MSHEANASHASGPTASRGARGDGRVALVAAARIEFEERGYLATNSNLIAKRAGYVSQTFYRHFADKLEIFLAVYDEWSREEIAILEDLGDVATLTDRLMRHHAEHRVFRRSLRMLAHQELRVAEARRAARELILERVMNWRSAPGVSRAQVLAALLIVERLCEAYAEGELRLYGVDDGTARSLIEDRVAEELIRSG